MMEVKEWKVKAMDIYYEVRVCLLLQIYDN